MKDDRHGMMVMHIKYEEITILIVVLFLTIYRYRLLSIEKINGRLTVDDPDNDQQV